jgi:hypothetical protein
MLSSVIISKNMHMHTLETYVFGLVSKLPAQLFLFYFYTKGIVTDNIITMFSISFYFMRGVLSTHYFNIFALDNIIFVS